MQNGALGLARTNYWVRSVAFAYCSVVVGMVLWERAIGALGWSLMVLQFLVYPHLVYLRAKLSPRPTRAELDNLFLDAALLGAWCASLGFPLWITFSFLGATMLNAVVNRGPRGLAWSLACSAAGAVLWVLVGGLYYAPQTSDQVTALCALGALAYSTMVGFVVHSQNRRLAAARDALRSSEERYRLITENAGDLIAVVDQSGRWLYTSPSYEKVIEPAARKEGVDAFMRVHPDDANQARLALLRASSTGKRRDVALRLVDRDGRMRQYRVHIQPFGTEKPAERLVLVSQDVTDLRASEERLLVAAHALEGMTEAILICAADGTIVTVNRAFSEITGYSKDDVLGQPEPMFRNALQPPQYYQEVYETVGREGYWSGTTWTRRKSGAVYREWRSIRALKDAAGTLTHYVIVFSEVGAPGAIGQLLPQRA